MAAATLPSIRPTNLPPAASDESQSKDVDVTKMQIVVSPRGDKNWHKLAAQRLFEHVSSLDEVIIWENQRFSTTAGWGSSYPLHLQSSDPGMYSSSDNSHSCMEMSLKGWVVDKDQPGADEEGWVYAGGFHRFSEPGSPNLRRKRSWSAVDPGLKTGVFSVRRRAWVPQLNGLVEENGEFHVLTPALADSDDDEQK